MALFNFAENERTVGVDELGEFRNLLNGEAADKTCITLEPGAFRWLLCDFTEGEKNDESLHEDREAE